MALVPRSRILSLLKAQCRIFDHTYNPEGIRLGNKVLRQRLRGQVFASYYPRNTVTTRDLQDAFTPFGLYTWNEDQEDRLASIRAKIARRKGTPKKKRTAAESKNSKKKK
ncbi:hypothetical protein LOZ58_000737 [Ophidiomyces ophidiicola]|nr:hypothetical protein LOZ66_000429 [Ophidiomyces ophidiicola]KAI1965837.1 hypothetical protein LOZ58_000737 [Ophidiomyces ophidiicola]